jgi:hypothetical protein
MRSGALWRHDFSISSRTRRAGTLDRSMRRPMNSFPLRQISWHASGCSAAAAFASCSARLTVMAVPPLSTPRKLFPAILKAAIRRAACTGGPSSTSGRLIAMARSSLRPINLNNPALSLDCMLARPTQHLPGKPAVRGKAQVHSLVGGLCGRYQHRASPCSTSE